MRHNLCFNHYESIPLSVPTALKLPAALLQIHGVYDAPSYEVALAPFRKRHTEQMNGCVLPSCIQLFSPLHQLVDLGNEGPCARSESMQL